MIRSLWTAASGMTAQKINMDVIANNLANVNTSGFKKSRADFEDLLYQNLKSPGADTSTGGQIPTGIQIGMGTRYSSVQKIFSQGDPVQTGNQLDLAIAGNGFFKVVTNNGDEVYTRAGSFQLDADGYIVTPQGDRLQPEVSIPTNSVSFTIDSSGALEAFDESGETTATAQLTITNFINPAGMRSLGGNYYSPTEASGDPTEGNPEVDGLGSIVQGSLEMSNVDVVEEMVNMIAGQRAYEISSKSIRAADEMMQMANNIKR